MKVEINRSDVETLLKVHDALLIALDATEDVPISAEHFIETNSYVRQALMEVVIMLRERVNLAPLYAHFH